MVYHKNKLFMKLNKSKLTAINFIILIFSLIIAFSFMEIVLGSIKLFQLDLKRSENQKILFNHLDKNKISFDKRSALEVYNGIKSEKIIFPKVVPGIKFDEFISLANISNSQIIDCNENGEYSIWRSDRYGFRNLDNIWDEKDLDIIFIGDSFTVGACVQNNQNISGNISKNYSKKILNLGVSGSGPLHQFAKLKEYTKSFKSEYLILIFYEGNDYKSLNTSKSTSPILYKYLENDNFSQNLISKQKIINKNLKQFIDLKEIEAQKRNFKKNELNTSILNYLSFSNFYKFYNLRSLITELLIKYDFVSNLRLFSNNKNKNKTFAIILDKFEEYAKNQNSEFIVVYMPSVERYGDKYNKISRLRLSKLDYIYKSITEIIVEKNIRYIDIKKKLFDEKKDINYLFPLKLAGYGHLSTKGYFEVSEVIYNFLYEKK